MMKVSAQWADRAKYTAFLNGLHSRMTLSLYSLLLHHKFLTAAQELATMCQVKLDELGLVYWSPTGSMVTVVMRVDDKTAERIITTSGLHFVPLLTVLPFITSMEEDILPEQWLADVVRYHECTRPVSRIVPLPPPPIVLSPIISFDTGRDRIRSIGNGQVAFVRRRTMTQVEPILTTLPSLNTISLGLVYVKVTPRGLYVMVPADGPYHSVPQVPLLTSCVPVNGLSTEQRDWLKELRRTLPSSNLIDGQSYHSLTGRERAVSSSAEHSQRRADSSGTTDEPSRLTSMDMIAPLESGSPPPLSGELAQFRASLHSAAITLAALLGTSCDLTVNHLTNCALIPLSAHHSILPVVVTRMGRPSETYSDVKMRWVLLKHFEVLKSASGMRGGWVKALLNRAGNNAFEDTRTEPLPITHPHVPLTAVE